MIVDQFRLPHGIPGAVIARMMGEENAGDYVVALGALDLRRGERGKYDVWHDRRVAAGGGKLGGD